METLKKNFLDTHPDVRVRSSLDRMCLIMMMPYIQLIKYTFL